MASWASSTDSVSTCWYGLHRLRDDKRRVRARCILDNLGIWTNLKTSYGIESLKETNLGKNCPWYWQENTHYCSVNIFKLYLCLFSFSFQTVMIIRGCSFPCYCKAKGTWIPSYRWYFPRASRATRPWDLCQSSWKLWKFTSSHRLWKSWILAEYLETQVNSIMTRHMFLDFKRFLLNICFYKPEQNP